MLHLPVSLACPSHCLGASFVDMMLVRLHTAALSDGCRHLKQAHLRHSKQLLCLLQTVLLNLPQAWPRSVLL